MKTRDELADAIRSLPDEPPIRETIERLEVARLVRPGILAADAGRVITRDKVERRVAQWRA